MRHGIIVALLCAAFSVTSFDAEAKRKRLSLGSWGSSKTTSDVTPQNRKSRRRSTIGAGAVDLGTGVYDGYDRGSSMRSSDFEHSERPTASVKRGACIPDLPKSFELHVAGVYEGTRTSGSNIRLGTKKGRAEQVDVYVARTHRPAVIVLGAYDPIVWTINASEGSNIAGVLVRGYHSQAISGLPEGVPVVFSTNKDGFAEGCGSRRVTHRRTDQWADEIQTVFGRSIASFSGEYRGEKFAIGRWTGLDAAPSLPISRDDLVASGRIRKVSYSSAGLGGGILLLMFGGVYYLRRRVAGGIVAGIFGIVSGL